MRKEVIILGVILLFLIGCSKILRQETVDLNQSKDGNLSIEKSANDTAKIVLGCNGDECHEYCQKNPEECKTWCNENPANYEDCKDLIASQGGQTGFPSGSPQPGFTGPGGCTGPDCATLCSTQPEVCQEWCEKNPQMCAMFMGGGPVGSEAVEPPATTITFAKTVNFNADQFTEQDISKAKELGANMVTIWPSRSFKDDEYTFSLPERLAPMINFAHKNGLQVELRGSYGGDEAQNYAKYKASAIEFVADFAKFAEKYKVYRIVPFGEIDNNMINHCGKITELAKELLTEMRKHYSGQIGVGMAAPWRDCGFSFEGYDYMTISAYAQSQTGTNVWLTTSPEVNVNNVISGARKVADRSSIKVLHVGETGVINPDDTKREDSRSFAMESKQQEAEFYQKFFGQVFDKANGLSVFYNSRMDYMSINGDPAEEVVKDWYNKLYPEEKSQKTMKIITANPLDLSQIARISKFRSCYGHDYSGLNIEGEKETLRSMKHYIEFFQQFLGSENTVRVFAPFDGKIAEIIEAGGKQVFISADAAPTWHFIFFHISPEPNIKEGTAIKAGQLVGHAYVREWPNFDFALKEFDVRGQIFESPFLHMQDYILEEYASYGITLENIIVTKQFRDTRPCPIQGTRDGEEAFTGETEKEDFVVLK